MGHHVTTVDIDHWGRFKFVLLRLHEPSGTRHKLLVRGKVGGLRMMVGRQMEVSRDMAQNYANETKLIASVQQEADGARVQHVLPHVKVQHVGTGVMEWSKDRDRRLHIVQGVFLLVVYSAHAASDVFARVGGGRSGPAWHTGCGAAGRGSRARTLAAQLLNHHCWAQRSIIRHHFFFLEGCGEVLVHPYIVFRVGRIAGPPFVSSTLVCCLQQIVGTSILFAMAAMLYQSSRCLMRSSRCETPRP